ncbi:hypothetical protein BGZ74_002627, partial [Mortierella antarctica]
EEEEEEEGGEGENEAKAAEATLAGQTRIASGALAEEGELMAIEEVEVAKEEDEESRRNRKPRYLQLHAP